MEAADQGQQRGRGRLRSQGRPGRSTGGGATAPATGALGSMPARDAARDSSFPLVGVFLKPDQYGSMLYATQASGCIQQLHEVRMHVE